MSPNQLCESISPYILQPTLVLEQSVLNENIASVRRRIDGDKSIRLVVKSLPCAELIKYNSDQLNCSRFMCFHGPFIKQTAKIFPKADILLGKPMPPASFEHLATEFLQEGLVLDNVQWLIDTHEHLDAYLEIAERLNINIRINLEINIGLNRGGFAHEDQLKIALLTIADSENLSFSGLMGYEAHASKIPDVFGGMKLALKQVTEKYRRFKAIAERFGNQEELTFNSAGSTTFTEYQGNDVINDISIGSIFVKPEDFELPHLNEFKPALFIATPILKAVEKPQLPLPQPFNTPLNSLFRFIGKVPNKGAYIYGGNWMASPFYPEGFKTNSLFGRSSNQEFISHTNDTLKPGDCVLFRPTQSEAVMLQFGELLLIKPNNEIDYWPVYQATQVRLDANKKGKSRES